MNNTDYTAKWLSELVKKDENVYLLIIDGWEYYLFDEHKKSMTDEQKSRIINMGISEQNAVSVASGLALGGKTVYLLMFASFLTSRAAEQIKLDACYNNANVKFIGIHGGISGPRIAGYSHWTLEDIAVLNSYPNIKIAVPSANESEMKYWLEYSYKNYGTMYIRIDKPGIEQFLPQTNVCEDKMSEITNPTKPDVAIIASGAAVQRAYEVTKTLEKFEYKPALYSCHCVKPFNFDGLKNIINRKIPIVVMEEHSKYGGITSIISDEIAHSNKSVRLASFNVSDNKFNKVFYSEQSAEELLGFDGLDKKIIDFIKKERCFTDVFFHIKRSTDKKNRVSIQYRIFGLPLFEKKKENNGRKLYYLFGVRVWKQK